MFVSEPWHSLINPDDIELPKGYQTYEQLLNDHPFLKEIAWRLEVIRSFLSGKKPLLTKETANSAMTTSKFSSAKIEKVIIFFL